MGMNIRERIRGCGIFLLILWILIIPSSSYARDNIRPTEVIDLELFENHGMPMMVIDSNDGRILAANKAAVDFYGYEASVLTSMRISEINTLSEGEVAEEMERAMKESRNYFLFNHRLSSGEVRTVEVYSYPVKTKEGNYLYSIINDITKRLEAEASLQRMRTIYISGSTLLTLLLAGVAVMLFITLRKRKIAEAMLVESEEGYAQLFDNMHEGYALHEIIVDDHGKPIDYRFLKVNPSFGKILGLDEKKILGKRVKEVLPGIEGNWIETYGRVALEGETLHIVEYSTDLNRHYSVFAYNAGQGRFITVFMDISDRKRKEKEIYFLNNHDQLTGLYNRRFMEEKLQELDSPAFLPLSIIMADVNGLKLCNDAFGHIMGDALLVKAAETFKHVFREEDIITRVGGDEFMILLPNTTRHTVNQIMGRLDDRFKAVQVGPVRVSLSLGAATKESVTEEIQGIYKKRKTVCII